MKPGLCLPLMTEDTAFDVFVILFMGALAAVTLGMLAVAVGVAAKEPDERVGVT